MDFYTRLFADGLSGSEGDKLFKLAVSGNLTTVNAKMLDGVTRIGDHAFYSCPLTSVTMPNSVTSIRGCAFEEYRSLTSITLPDSVTSIGNYGFKYCGLTSIEIPDSVTSIGKNAFESCTSLTSVTVLATTPPTLGTGVFSNTHSSLKIYVPSKSVNAYKTATNWKSYASKIYAIPS